MSSLVFISGFSGSPIILKLSLLPLFSRSITLSVRYFMFSSNFLVFWLCFISSCFKAWFSFTVWSNWFCRCVNFFCIISHFSSQRASIFLVLSDSNSSWVCGEFLTFPPRGLPSFWSFLIQILHGFVESFYFLWKILENFLVYLLLSALYFVFWLHRMCPKSPLSSYFSWYFGASVLLWNLSSLNVEDWLFLSLSGDQWL